MNKKGFPFKIINAIACEDIREEARGKHTLVGVYSGIDIQISQIPGNIAIACFMEIQVIKSGDHGLNLRLSGPGDHNALLKARLNFPAEGAYAVIPTPRMDLLVDKEGTFRLDIGSDELGWKNVLTREIVLNPLIAPSQRTSSDLSESSATGEAFPHEPSSPSRRKRPPRH